MTEISRTGSSKRSTLKIVALGGLCEIGKNMMAIAYEDDIMLVDAGLGFPSEDLLGVDIVLPDITFLKENGHKLKGIAVTHGHEDHIGGIPYLLREVSVPVIYGPALALGLLESKLKEAGLANTTQLSCVKPRQRVKLGCFDIQFVRATHSIADAYSLIIRTPIGTIIHTGDFKFDFTPVDGEMYDIACLTKAADEEEILLLMSDSTNSEREGFTLSEKTVWKGLNDAFSKATSRIIVTTFASNVHRMRQILQASLKYDRKVAILGRSMINTAGISRELGYMKFSDDLFIDIRDINKIEPERLVIVTTGSQGEPLSGLTRIAKGQHKQVRINPGDTVIFSASPIPGNERSVANTINTLFTLGADVVYGSAAGVHVSGHACREEQKLMINLCRPKFFMPIHGEYRMLVIHAELAVQCGVDIENTFVMKNGDVLELSKEKASVSEQVKAGVILLDNSRIYPIDLETISERKLLSESGMVNVVVTLSKEKQMLCPVDINTKGLTIPRKLDIETFIDGLSKSLETTVKADPAVQKLSGSDLRDHLIGVISKYAMDTLGVRPLIQVIVHELNWSEPSKNKAHQPSKLRKCPP